MSLRVLIVEDDDLLRDMYALRLGMEGYIVDTAHDGLEGLDKARQVLPDVVVLDMLMPRLDGLGFLGAFSKLGLKARTKVIVASNKSSAASIHQAKVLGAVEYLIKSQITPDDLVDCVKKHVTSNAGGA